MLQFLLKEATTPIFCYNIRFKTIDLLIQIKKKHLNLMRSPKVSTSQRKGDLTVGLLVFSHV